MSIIVEFTLPAEAFLLGQALSAAPEMVIEIERVVAHTDDRVTPYFWIAQGEYEAFEAAFADDPSVDDVVLVDDFGEAVLYRAEWQDEGNGIVDAFRTIDVALLDATGQRAAWTLRMRFDERADLAEFNDYRRDNDVSVTVERIYHPDEPSTGGHYDLTPVQRATLSEALSMGYYGVPRAVTHAELAERLDVSQQSVSNRLHRAHGNLVRNALTVANADPDAERSVRRSDGRQP